ncbi:MAG: hypothetical protein HQM16_08225 [Deltaproteobacteria bacterium]|nr:hypothetical protein [Deltaproteobacteria bacterium]
MTRLNISHRIDITVKNMIIGHGKGWSFTAHDFVDLGSQEAVWKSLQRLCLKGTIRRLAQGIYNYPRVHPKIGFVFPGVDSIARAIARKYSIRIQPSGAYAANVLHLSEQVPARVVYLTEGQTKKIRVSNTTIIFKRTTPKNMTLAESEMGLIIQALKYFGRKNITPEMISFLKPQLIKMDSKTVKVAMKVAPVWMTKLFKQMRGEKGPDQNTGQSVSKKSAAM